MALALTDDHLALAATVGEVLEKRDARGAARRLLEAPAEELPDTPGTAPAERIILS